MKEKLDYIGIKLTKMKRSELEKYANKYHNGNISKAIREFVDKGLSINAYKDEISFIRQMINEELESILEPYMSRLISISVKGGVMSASSHFALGEVLSKLVNIKDRRILEEVLMENKKRGYAYMISKDFKIQKE